MDIVNAENNYLTCILASYKNCKKFAEQGSKHLDYLKKEWLRIELYNSWSQYGPKIASSAFGIPVDGVLTMTNHLESFNGLLKKTHLEDWRKSGWQLHIDTFVNFLIMSICPKIFCRLSMEASYKIWLKERFPQVHTTQVNPPAGAKKTLDIKCAYWQDQTRDKEAKQIIKNHRITVTSFSTTQFIGSCAALAADITVVDHPCYSLLINVNGFSTCTCLDFITTNIACKHLQAMSMILSGWAQSRFIHPIYYPSTKCEADPLADQRKITLPEPSVAPMFEIEKFTASHTLDTIISIKSQNETIFEANFDDKCKRNDGENSIDKESVSENDARGEIESVSMELFQNNVSILL